MAEQGKNLDFAFPTRHPWDKITQVGKGDYGFIKPYGFSTDNHIIEHPRIKPLYEGIRVEYNSWMADDPYDLCFDPTSHPFKEIYYVEYKLQGPQLKGLVRHQADIDLPTLLLVRRHIFYLNRRVRVVEWRTQRGDIGSETVRGAIFRAMETDDDIAIDYQTGQRFASNNGQVEDFIVLQLTGMVHTPHRFEDPEEFVKYSEQLGLPANLPALRAAFFRLVSKRKVLELQNLGVVSSANIDSFFEQSQRWMLMIRRYENRDKRGPGGLYPNNIDRKRYPHVQFLPFLNELVLRDLWDLHTTIRKGQQISIQEIAQIVQGAKDLSARVIRQEVMELLGQTEANQELGDLMRELLQAQPDQGERIKAIIRSVVETGKDLNQAYIFYHVNPWLINRTTPQTSEGHTPTQASIRQAIQSSGGRAPRKGNYMKIRFFDPKGPI